MTEPTIPAQRCANLFDMPRTQQSAMKSTGGVSVKMPPPKARSSRDLRDVEMSPPQLSVPMRRQPDSVATKLADVCTFIFWHFRYWFLYSGVIPAWMAGICLHVTCARGSFARCVVWKFRYCLRSWRNPVHLIDSCVWPATTIFTARINRCSRISYVASLSSPDLPQKVACNN